MSIHTAARSPKTKWITDPASSRGHRSRWPPDKPSLGEWGPRRRPCCAVEALARDGIRPVEAELSDRSLLRANALPHHKGKAPIVYPIHARGRQRRYGCFWPQAVGVQLTMERFRHLRSARHIACSGLAAGPRQIACKQGSYAFGRSRSTLIGRAAHARLWQQQIGVNRQKCTCTPLTAADRCVLGRSAHALAQKPRT
jgi:hypothetical protein